MAEAVNLFDTLGIRPGAPQAAPEAAPDAPQGPVNLFSAFGIKPEVPKPGASFGEKFVATPIAGGVSDAVGLPRGANDIAEGGALWLANKVRGWTGKAPLSQQEAAQAKADVGVLPSPLSLLPTSEQVHGGIQKVADLADVNTNAKAESAGGRIAQGALRGAVGGALLPVGGFIPSVASGAFGGAGSEAAGELFKGSENEGLARIIGAVGAGSIPILLQHMASPSAGRVLRDAVGTLTPSQVQRVEDLLAAGRGNLTAIEAIQQVAGPNRRLATIQAVTEAGSAPNSQLGQMIANRSQLNRELFDQTVPRVPEAAIETIPQRVQTAANGALNTTPEAAAVGQAQWALPRTTPEMAGNVIRPELAAGQQSREGMRSALASGDYAAARASGEVINTDPVIDLIAQKARTVAGETAGEVEKARQALMLGNAPRAGVDQLVESDKAIGALINKAYRAGDDYTAHHLEDIQGALRAQLDAAPQAGQARRNYAAASRPLEPFEQGVVGQSLERQPFSSRATPRYEMPVEQVAPSIWSGGPTEIDNFLQASASRPGARQGLADYVGTVARENATDAAGRVDPQRLRGWLATNEDALNRLPDVRNRLENLAIAQEGRDALDRTLTGRLAASQEFKQQAALLLDPAETVTPAQITRTVNQLRLQDPQAATDLVNRAIRVRFNASNADNIPGANPFGGAKFRKAMLGEGEEQAANLEALVRALPNGNEAWHGLQRMFDVFEAQGKRMAEGSNTAYASQALSELKGGNLRGAVNIAMRGPWRSLLDWAERSNYATASRQIGNAITSEEGLAALRRLALASPTSERAAGLTVRALGIERAEEQSGR